MATIPLTITGIQEAKAQLAELDKAFKKVKDDPIESKKLAKQFNDLSKDIDKATESFNEMNNAGTHLSATFEEIYGEGVLPLNTQIGEMEDRLYALARAGQQNSQEFKDLTAEVSNMRTVIRETDKQIDLMTENKGLAVFGEGFAQIGGSLMRLDFQTAGKDAEALNNAVGNLGKLGSQALSGLGKTVGQLSKAFIKMGVSLLANPIFLIAAVIAGVIAVIVALMNKLGILQPILDGIAYVFGVIKDAIDSVVQSLKDFLDWIGLTSYAAEEAAQRQIEANKKVVASQDEKLASTTKAYDQEIRLAQIAGKDTTDQEIKKQQAIIETSKVKYRALLAQLEANKTSKSLSEEEVKQLREQAKATRELIEDSRFEIKAIKAQQVADTKKANEDEAKANKDAYKQMLADRKEYEKNRLEVAREIRDIELSLMKDGEKKDIEQTREQYKRKLEDLEANEKYTSEEKIKLRELIAEQEYQAEIDIYTKYEEERIKKEKELEEKRLKELADIQKQADEQFAKDEAERIKKEEEDNEKKLAIEENYINARKELAGSLQGSLSELATRLEAEGVRTAGLQKTLALVEIATSTAKAISNVIAGATAAALGSGPGAPFVLAGYIASGIATVASAILSAKQALDSAPSIGGGGGGGSIGNIGGGTATAPAQPSFNLFGQNNNANNLSSAQDVESGQEITVKAVVSETEVTDTQNKIKKIQDLASL